MTALRVSRHTRAVQVSPQRPPCARESLQAEAQDQLDEILRQSPVTTRSTAEYQALLEETVTHDESDEDDDPSA